jgi:hypothetical protein
MFVLEFIINMTILFSYGTLLFNSYNPHISNLDSIFFFFF